jgi:hypothetical protein
MPDGLALIATMDPAVGVATARVRGEFGPAGYARLRDDLLWVAANGTDQSAGHCDAIMNDAVNRAPNSGLNLHATLLPARSTGDVNYLP